jgi:ubiquinone/menaquinone biosynthesis C-methylase UbiE
VRLHVPHRNRPGAFEGRGSRLYDFAARRLLRGVYRRIAADLAPAIPTGAALLDIGTGPGVLLAEVARLRLDVRLTGVDLSPDMIAAASRNLREYGDRVTARVGDVTDLPFADASFDVIVSSFSLHHWDHPERAAGELARVLRPGGRLYVYDFPFAPFDKLTAAAHRESVFAAQPPERARFRTGRLVFPRCDRYLLSAHTAPAG